ncbi:MAG: M20/M25/M40 family metallo-hydrolase [Nitrosopumilaceae archaeon]|nr:M20/M25/M40 family metallo-hydrolase [Nitrosopumilaceae archaeon]NIU00430.1 M20/M25/M40 family metallo-hydrolase [Nitrosopumilaceae archaeon]NIU87107.1 M20/M25/M40 family metallo-hydrolase [Nitrosopumilaceae archaeon]NIV65662.1 M20/M25/M40 family metallo-hydrolase [Nitrosopumilaceae archaeon]NIX61032.1 M20/M25/M40 family metallo-hydrolase [Nitrosopumilaceae archaeon]
MKVAVIYNKKHIESNDVINVFGTPTKEYYNPKTVELVAKSLEKGGNTVKVIEGGMNTIDEMREFMPKVIAGDRPGMVFNMAYGIQGQNRYTHVPAMLEMLGIPYIGSGPEAHAVVQDKVMTKIVLQKHYLPTPGFWVFSSPDDKFDDLVFPVIVKPKMESTSMGMQVVDNWNDLRSAVSDQMEKYSQEILVEQFIPGREFAVGLIGNGTNIEVLPIVELDLEGDPNRIQTKSEKLSKPMDKICPAPISEEQKKDIEKTCIEAFRKLGINDFCRVDIRMDNKGNIYILELNSMASLGQTGTFVYASKTAGYSYESLINKILETACLRYFGESIFAHHEADTEQKSTQPLRSLVRSYLRSHLTTTEKLLEQVVNINSSTQNIEEINRLGKFLSNQLEHLGFKTQRYPEFDVGDFLYFRNHDEERNDILLLSHIDTLYSNHDFSPYYKLENKLYGSGIAESKGGIVTMISALKSLRFSRRLRKIKIGILFTTDESLGGRYSKKLVKEVSDKSNYVVELKWGTIDGGITVSCSGVTEYHIDMSHVRGPHETIKDVIPDMCKRVVNWKKISREEEDARITITEFQARTSFGKAPDYGRLTLESRFKTKEQGDMFDEKIRKIAKRPDKARLDVHVQKRATRPPVVETEKTKKFYEMINDIAKRMDIKLKPIHRYPSSDLSYVSYEIPMLGGVGPVGGDIRSSNEYILRDSLIDRAALLAVTLDKCSKTSI